MIAHGPLHRSGRADLPHPAPALGDNAEAHQRVGMTDRSRWEPTLDVTLHAVPRDMVALTTMTQNEPPQPCHCRTKGTQRRTIHRHPIVAEVAEKDRSQVGSLFLYGRVHASPQFVFQPPQLGLPPLPHRPAQHRKVPLPGLPATVRKAQEVERLRFAVTTLASVLLRIAAKLDDTRFVGMERQSELSETFAQFSQKSST